MTPINTPLDEAFDAYKNLTQVRRDFMLVARVLSEVGSRMGTQILEEWLTRERVAEIAFSRAAAALDSPVWLVPPPA